MALHLFAEEACPEPKGKNRSRALKVVKREAHFGVPDLMREVWGLL
jgi:hypothetical protein